MTGREEIYRALTWGCYGYGNMLSLPAFNPSAERPCKICGQPAPLYGAVDFNRVCADADPCQLPPANVLVPYNRCGSCGFVFTSCFDSWSHEDFAAHIYNDLYIRIDPDYEERRPAANLTWIVQEFGQMRRTSRFLDYGGGNGRLAELMRQNGFNDVETYDPFDQRHSRLPSGTFTFISCFETLEHVPDPVETIARLISLAAPKAVVFFSTLLQPDNFLTCGLFWPYVAPRNGHISIYTPASLTLLFARFGYTVMHLDHDKHVAMPQGVVRTVS